MWQTLELYSRMAFVRGIVEMKRRIAVIRPTVVTCYKKVHTELEYNWKSVTGPFLDSASMVIMLTFGFFVLFDNIEVHTFVGVYKTLPLLATTNVEKLWGLFVFLYLYYWFLWKS